MSGGINRDEKADAPAPQSRGDSLPQGVRRVVRAPILHHLRAWGSGKTHKKYTIRVREIGCMSIALGRIGPQAGDRPGWKASLYIYIYLNIYIYILVYIVYVYVFGQEKRQNTIRVHKIAWLYIVCSYVAARVGG